MDAVGQITHQRARQARGLARQAPIREGLRADHRIGDLAQQRKFGRDGQGMGQFLQAHTGNRGKGRVHRAGNWHHDHMRLRHAGQRLGEDTHPHRQPVARPRRPNRKQQERTGQRHPGLLAWEPMPGEASVASVTRFLQDKTLVQAPVLTWRACNG